MNAECLRKNNVPLLTKEENMLDKGKGKGPGKAVPGNAKKAHRKNRKTSPHVLNLDTRRGEWSTSLSGRFNHGKRTYWKGS